jgi:hypothetical protein
MNDMGAFDHIGILKPYYNYRHYGTVDLDELKTALNDYKHLDVPPKITELLQGAVSGQLLPRTKKQKKHQAQSSERMVLGLLYHTRLMCLKDEKLEDPESWRSSGKLSPSKQAAKEIREEFKLPYSPERLLNKFSEWKKLDKSITKLAGGLRD